MEDNQTKRIKEICVGILDEIDRVCKEAGLQYYLYAGTLLGAVRHGGFIPWDDDIDIVMFRKDYDAFVDACDKYLNKDEYELQTIISDPEASNPWMKLHAKNTAFISGLRRAGAFEGINIDIFPVDNAPDDKAELEKRAKYFDRMNFIYQWRFQEHKKNATWKMKIYQKAISLIPPINEKKFKLKYDKEIQKYNDVETENVVYFSNRKYIKKVISRHCFDSVVMMNFDGKEYPAPSGWKDVLVGLYGPNYMELPPEDQRVTVHGTKIIDTEKSWRCYKGE